jgi:hypothetical protein
MLPEVMAPDIGTDCAIPMRWGDGREQSDCDASGKKKPTWRPNSAAQRKAICVILRRKKAAP